MRGLENLPEQVRPCVHEGDIQLSSVLTGDKWAPAINSMISGARSSISVMAFAVFPRWPGGEAQKNNIIEGLKAAPGKGIRCRIILASHKPGSRSAGFNKKAALVLSDAGWKVRWYPVARLLHAKVYIFDKDVVSLGSHNTSHSAAANNLDVSLMFSGSGQIRDIVGIFEAAWKISKSRATR